MVILLNKFWFSGLAIFPFIFIRKEDYSINLLNHEYIHLKQQKEMLFIFAYLWYVIEYLIKLLYYRNFRKAYLSVSFEREARVGGNIIGYIGNRPMYNWLKFVWLPKYLK